METILPVTPRNSRPLVLRWRQTVLRHVDLTVGGETVVLLGRSGSGKTTLLKTVNGLVPAAAGRDPVRRAQHFTMGPPSDEASDGIRHSGRRLVSALDRGGKRRIGARLEKWSRRGSRSASIFSCKP
ncbi:MAG: ATP-binding cassette domain-containing protein [Ignavibacteriota bacterium]